MPVADHFAGDECHSNRLKVKLVPKTDLKAHLGWLGAQAADTHHSEGWWMAAETVLQADGCVKHGDRTIGVTPAVLSTHVRFQHCSVVDELRLALSQFWGVWRSR